jgi:single-strand DNA-binding protein
MKKEVSFFDIESWGNLAESCSKLGRKGRGVRVVGRLRQDRWQSADGKNHARFLIVAEHIEFRPEFIKEDDEHNEDLAETVFDSDYNDFEQVVTPEL